MTYLALIFIFGLAIGSFLNAAIYRLEIGESVAKGRSKCPKCGRILSWYELLPLVSFVIQKGKCRKCKEKISWQYPIVEFLTATLFSLTFLSSNFPKGPTFTEGQTFGNFSEVVALGYLLAVFSFLVLIFVFDFKHYIIPNVAIYSVIAISFFYNLIFNSSDIFLNILAALIASGFFLFLYLISSGKWIGMGDVKYGVFMGLFLGWPDILAGLFVSYIIGAVVGIIMMALKKKGLKSEIPFGPFLIIGTIVAFFWGSEIIKWYLLGLI